VIEAEIYSKYDRDHDKGDFGYDIALALVKLID